MFGDLYCSHIRVCCSSCPLHLFIVQVRTYDFIGAPLCHCSNRQIAEPEIIEEGEVFRRWRYEESSEEEQSEEEDVDEEVRVVKRSVR